MKAREALIYFSELTTKIIKGIDRTKYTYTIHDNDFFRDSFSSNINELHRIYWEEILQRAHWAGLTSIIRNFNWIKGTVSSMQTNNLLAFTANLRCLIESSGDSMLSLLPIPMTLAKNFKNISLALQNKIEDNNVFLSNEIEELLIHFSYARKITSLEKEIEGKMPKYQNSKPAFEYLKALDNKVENGPISELYSILCQFSHPAAHSIHYLLNMDSNDEKYSFKYSYRADNENINRIINQFNDEIVDSLYYGFNPGILTLKTLNFFDFKLVKTPYVDKVNTDDIKTWNNIIEEISNRF